LISLWWFFILLTANPQWFGLPGTGVINNFTIFISAYFPVSVVIGCLISWPFADAQSKIREKVNPAKKWDKSRLVYIPSLIVVILISLISLWGARRRLDDVLVAQHALVTRPDVRAADWIKENLPQDAQFLVNSSFAFEGTSIVGSDAGWWLPLLADRKTTVPPLIYSFERGPYPGYREWVNALTSEIQSKGINHPDVIDMLRHRRVTHVYIGQQQGSVGNVLPLLDSNELIASPAFTSIYHQDRVWIFEVSQ
jgi:hypothetical protein